MAVYLPQSRMPYQANILSKKALHVLQPNRAINQAKTQYENIPSVENAVALRSYITELLIAKSTAGPGLIIAISATETYNIHVCNSILASFFLNIITY